MATSGLCATATGRAGRVVRCCISRAALLVKVTDKNAFGSGAAADQFGDPVGDHAGLAGAGAGEDQQRARNRQHRFPLAFVQAVESIDGCRRTHYCGFELPFSGKVVAPFGPFFGGRFGGLALSRWASSRSYGGLAARAPFRSSSASDSRGSSLEASS